MRYRTSLSSDNAGGQSKTTADIGQLALTFELDGERHQALLKFTELGCLLLKLPHPGCGSSLRNGNDLSI